MYCSGTANKGAVLLPVSYLRNIFEQVVDGGFVALLGVLTFVVIQHRFSCVVYDACVCVLNVCVRRVWCICVRAPSS